MSAAKLALLAGAALVAGHAAQAQTPGPLDRLLSGSAPAAPAVQPPAPSGPTLPTLPAQPTAPSVQPPAPPTSPAATAPQPAPPAPPPAALQVPPAMPPTDAARPGAGPNVQFQAPPPATTPLERPATPPAAELDMMSRLQADIARLRLELEKARLEREIAQQRQPPPTATPAAASTPAAPVRPAAAPPPPPAAMPRPDPAAADRRALPQVIEIRGAAGTFVAVVQIQGGQRLTLRAGDDLPNSPLKVQSIEPWQVNFVSQEGNRGPYPVPVSPPGTTAPAAGVPQGPVVRPITDAGLATPIVR